MLYFRSFTHFIIGPILLFGHYADLIKDAILVYRLQLSLGGFAAILYRVDTFSSVVSITVTSGVMTVDIYLWHAEFLLLEYLNRRLKI